MLFDEIKKEITPIAYLYHFFTLLEADFDFLSLESSIQEVSESPKFAYFLLNLTCRLFFQLSFCQET